MKRTTDTLFIAMLLLLMLLPAAGLFGASRPVNVEDRDQYIGENMAFRDALITLHAKASEAVFGQTGNEQVLLGKEGWLFFSDTLPDYFRRNSLTDEEIARLARSIADLSQSLRSRGVGFTFLCAPNKNTIYPEYMPFYAVSPGGAGNMDRLQAALLADGVDVLDAGEVLRAHKAEGPLYHKTDTHWNARGALCVYRALMERLAARQGEALRYDPYDLPFDAGVPLRGDLAALYLPLSRETEADAVPAIERRYTVDGAMRSLWDMEIRTRSDANNLLLLVLRDSFGDALFPYLANNAQRLVFIRGTLAEEALLTREGITHVVLQIAERNLHTLLLD